MGNWNINVQGVGCHHNGPSHNTDANNMARRFVEELRKAGHTIQGATFTHGGAETLSVLPLKHEGLGRDLRTTNLPPPEPA